MDAREPRGRSPEWLFAALIALGTAAFIAVTAWELIVPGPFDWHIRLDRTWQGGIEAIALIALVAAGLRRNSMPALLLLVALPAVFYLRRHAVDLPFVVDAFYVEAIFAIGALGRRCCGADPAREGDDFVRDFVLGLGVWSIAAWTVSAFGLGSVIDLRWLTLVLAAIAFAARPRLATVELWRQLRAGTPATRLIDGALLGWGLVLYARAGIAHGFDSLWYALRPEIVLVADGSAFRSLGLVVPVYYFPKLYELFLAPLAALENPTVMIGVGLWLLLMIGIVCARLLGELGVSPVMRRLGVALCVTLPAIANIASVEAKPDTLALLLVLMALLEAMRFARNGESAHLHGFAAYALLATQAKLTAIPYVGMLALALATVVWQKRVDLSRCGDRRAIALARVTLACTAATAAFVTARTWILTGVPTIGPDPLVALWRAFGMTMTPPTGTLRWTWPQTWGDVPMLFVDELFRPQRLPHIVITWLGNAWLLLAAAACIAFIARRHARQISSAGTLRLGGALMVTGLALLIGWRYGDRGSDGNYFAAAAVAAIVFAFAALSIRAASRPVL
ncbi:MAG TPA: hypothetical protein VJ696_09930, partial [Rhodanobacteraceae bacterium]|nr:hypothetical protein [Rhodanobacteraceae bacterium]